MMPQLEPAPRSSWFQRYLLPGFALRAVIIGGGYRLPHHPVAAGPQRRGMLFVGKPLDCLLNRPTDCSEAALSEEVDKALGNFIHGWASPPEFGWTGLA